MMGRGYRESCRDLFKELDILPLRSQYIYSLMMFVIKNREKFVTNKDYHKLKTRQDLNMHMHQVNLAIFSKGVYHIAIKVFDGLPDTLKINSSYLKKFKANLKDFLYFNTMEEFLIDVFHLENGVIGIQCAYALKCCSYI
jgi:hypothetical protein